MAGRKEEITDEDIKKALIESNGQPTKAAEILEVTYPHLYTRIRKNPELLEVQKAYRARTFQNVSNLTLTTFLTGVMKAPAVDENGEILKDENGKIIYKDVYIDTRTRLSLAPNLMQTFKSDDGITDKLDITSNGNSINTGFKIEVIDKREDVRTEEEENE
ncbi:hypothetical protein CAPN004_10650 [Capnocytophaga cynodegmi]|uniref:hypothetical protein n=1 Tax=Capnocytophaga cynodegmi TaxID=28189 RepID=UPI001AC86564|nr:hypothetical protein [Capnocytophaga cynodegmi]GIM52035.1 hypothetical protein CAPN004_10650 [Capnocytophaga cynodegmi]